MSTTHQKWATSAPTPMQTDNTTTVEVINSNIQPQQTKAMDMRCHWLRCREAQQLFRFFLLPGKINLADYYTKYHCSAHHIEQRPQILTPPSVITALQASKQCTPAPMLN